MARVMLTARVTDTQAAALKAWAAEAGLPAYQATVRALEIGIAALVGRQDAKSEPGVASSASNVAGLARNEAIETALGELFARADRSDALLRQTLFAAGAAYAAALAAAGEGASAERAEAIKGEVARDAERVFERQLAKAQEA